MTRRQHQILFLILLLVCLIAIFVFPEPIRNFIPVIWGFIGFGFHALLFTLSCLMFNSILFDKHIDFIQEKKIDYYKHPFIGKSIHIIDIFFRRKELESISEEIKVKLLHCLTLFRLTLIAFFITAIFGFLIVLT